MFVFNSGLQGVLSKSHANYFVCHQSSCTLYTVQQHTSTQILRTYVYINGVPMCDSLLSIICLAEDGSV